MELKKTHPKEEDRKKMSEKENRPLFHEELTPENITYRSRLVFCVISIIPLVTMTYLSYKYVFPFLDSRGDDTLKISAISIIILSVFLSVFGYLFSQRDGNRTIKAMGRTNRQLATLFKVANSLSSTVHIDIILKEILESGTKLIEGESGTIFLRENGNLICREVAGSAKNRNKGKELPVNGSPYENVILKKDILIFNKTSDSGEINSFPAGKFSDKNDWFDDSVNSLICLPLIYNDEAIGILEVFNKKGKKGFDETDKKLLENLAVQASISIKNAEFYDNQNNFSIHMLELLVSAMEDNVAWEGHLHNVARYCNFISRKLNLPESERKNLHFAALLHDIGMLKIEPISRTVPEEFQKHPAIGSEMIKPITIWKKIHPIILHHHENFDGSGYPEKLKGEEIPIGARIIHVVEAYDTLTNEETYSGVLSRDEAMKELERCAGTKYDPKIINVFLAVLKEQEA